MLAVLFCCFATTRFGVVGVTAALTAVFAAWLTSVISIGLGVFCSGPQKSMMQFGLGMVVRVVGLLIVCLFVQELAPTQLSYGFLIYLLLSYFVGLAFETLIVLAGIPRVNASSGRVV